MPDDDPLTFLTFADLREMRVVGSRADLSRKISRCGFPKPLKLNSQAKQARAVWKRADVLRWVSDRANGS